MAVLHAPKNAMTEGSSGLGFATLPMPMAVLDGELAIQEANPAFAELLQVPAASLIGEPLGKRLRTAATDVPDGDGVQTFGFQCADGPRWLRLDLQEHGGQILAIMFDVTGERTVLERMKADFAARGRLMHDAEVGIWRYDPDAELYHFPSELALGHGDNQEPVPVATLQLIQHEDDRAIDTAIRERLTHEEGTAEADMRYRTGDGGWRVLRVLYRSGRRTRTGRYEMYGLSQNVTDLAQARDEANANAQRLKLALTAARAGVFGYDYREGEFWLSHESRELLGPDAAQVITADAFAVFHADDRDFVRDLKDASAAAGQAVSADVRLLRPEGMLWVRLYWQTECDAAGEAIRGVGLLLDIDDQKRQELALTEARLLAESATASKSSFLASVSHEIRTPMNGIVGVLNLLKREGLSTEGRDLLGEALACSDMLAQLIDDVLDFSKMEAGKLDVTPAPTDPAAVLSSVVALLHPQADGKNLYLRAVIEPLEDDGAGWAMIDPVRLRQCLFNIIGNAVKFTETGGVEVRMAFKGEAAARKLRIDVHDTGVGVPEAAKAALFDRFQQAHAGATRKFGGTGLGLAISRSLAQLMGGEMGFESTEGVGSIFWFEISAPHAEPVASAPEVEASEAPLAGLKILVVDDNRTNRLVGLKSLEALGAEAETADSGEAAIAAAAKGGYDLILMDVNMPGMDGLEATRRIRELPQPHAAVPVVALTADVMTHHQAAYHAAGMNGFVPKPFSPGQLLSEIVRIAG
jgi:signal transduction histidine kinase